jgi:hypothetical protein
LQHDQLALDLILHVRVAPGDAREQRAQLVLLQPREQRFEVFDLGEALRLLQPGDEQRRGMFATAALANRAGTLSRRDAVVIQAHLDTIGAGRRAAHARFERAAVILAARAQHGAIAHVAPAKLEGAVAGPCTDVGHTERWKFGHGFHLAFAGSPHPRPLSVRGEGSRTGL